MVVVRLVPIKAPLCKGCGLPVATSKRSLEAPTEAAAETLSRSDWGIVRYRFRKKSALFWFNKYHNPSVKTPFCHLPLHKGGFGVRSPHHLHNGGKSVLHPSLPCVRGGVTKWRKGCKSVATIQSENQHQPMWKNQNSLFSKAKINIPQRRRGDKWKRV